MASYVRVEQYRVEPPATRVLCRLVELLLGVSASYRYPIVCYDPHGSTVIVFSCRSILFIPVRVYTNLRIAVPSRRPLEERRQRSVVVPDSWPRNSIFRYANQR